MVVNADKENTAFFWQCILDVSAIFIPALFFHFTLSFLKPSLEKKEKLQLIIIYCVSLALAILSFTSLFKVGVAPIFGFNFWIKPGPLYVLFPLFFVGLILYSSYLFVKKYSRAKEVIRLQIKYILLAALLGFGGGATNFFPQLIRVLPVGNYFVALYVLIIIFAITRYHLFEIRVILTEILVGGMGIILLVLLFLMPTGGLRMLLGIVLVLFLIFGYLLIKYTYEQERRREIAEEIAEKERKLRQRAERIAHELQHLNQIRNQMFLTGQHHTRTPLSNIKNFASVLLSGGYGPINKEQKHALEVIMSQVNQSIELANLYLSVSQFEAGRALLKKERTDICQLIKEQIEKLKIEAQAKGVKIITRFEKDIPQAEVDKTQLGLSIFAIIDNAIKYSPRGRGRVEVSIKKKDHNRILLSFKDNGIGIAKENIDYIGRFAFQRTERAKRIHGTGKGLALYFANLVVKEHKGKLWVESEGPNKGATFYIELPVKQPTKV